MDLIPGLGRSPAEGSGNSLQYSCMENPMDRGARRATVLGVTKSRVRHNLAPEHTHKGGVCKGVDGERAPTRNGEMLQDQSQWEAATFLDEQEAGAWQELWVSERGGLEGVVTLGGIKQTLSMCCPAGRESGNKHLTFSPAIHWLDGTSTCQIQWEARKQKSLKMLSIKISCLGPQAGWGSVDKSWEAEECGTQHTWIISRIKVIRMWGDQGYWTCCWWKGNTSVSCTWNKILHVLPDVWLCS